MPKKKQCPNSFSLFVTDWKKQYKDDLGLAGKSESEVLKLCEAAWKSSPEKQSHYRELSAQAKGKVKLQVEFNTKYTCAGETYESKEAEREEAQAFIDNMIREIESTINDLSSSGVEALVNHRFYLIHANYYIEWTAEKKFIPCEVAIAEYSIAQGVQDILHFFPGVDTPDGMLPLGYAFEAKDKADSFHEIPLPPFEPAEKDLHVVSSQVLNFLTKNGTLPIPPVYTMDDNMNCNFSRSTVCDFMEILRDFSGKVVPVYRLPLLFFELYNACAKFEFGTKEPFASDMNCQEELSGDPYMYVQGIGCLYHTLLDSDAHRFCSQSIVQRWAYILSEYCCREVGIEQIPGKHCPLASATESIIVRKRLRFGRSSICGDYAEWKSSPGKPQIADKGEEPLFRRPEPDEASAPIFKFGQEAGIVSEIRREKTHKFVEGTGVRLPKTRGKADVLISKQKSTEFIGFTKDDFPTLGKATANVSQWKPEPRTAEEPGTLTKDDFPALCGQSGGRGKK